MSRKIKDNVIEKHTTMFYSFLKKEKSMKRLILVVLVLMTLATETASAGFLDYTAGMGQAARDSANMNLMNAQREQIELQNKLLQDEIDRNSIFAPLTWKGDGMCFHVYDGKTYHTTTGLFGGCANTVRILKR